VSPELPQPAPGVPVFFVSYAHADPGAGAADRAGDDQHVWRFYEDLSRHVRQLLGLRTGTAPGFIDHSMKGGERWEGAILAAVRTASVLVALVSADYLQSPWCAREWDAFSRRRAARKDGRPGGENATTVVPVTWSPVPSTYMPPTIQSVHRFGPNAPGTADLRASYEQNGIYGLLVRNSPLYDTVVWDLARHVADLFYTFDVAFGAELTTAELHATFEAEADE